MSADRETLQRVRRIETRLTQLMIALDVDTLHSKPEFRMNLGSLVDPAIGEVILPHTHSSMKEVLDSIPATWDGPVNVYIRDELVATLDRPGNRP